MKTWKIYMTASLPYYNIKELPKFTFKDIDPLGKVSHKTVTAIVSSMVIIIVLILITMCCCTICSGNMSI